MKYCVFCGSPAVSWPSNASEYARGYSLCEHHIGPAIKAATKNEYNPDKVAVANFSEKICQSAEKMIRQWYEENNPRKLEQEVEFVEPDEIGLEFERVAYSLRSAAQPASAGEPIKTWVDDQELDRFLSDKITRIAREGGYKRCQAEIIGKPDNRCTNKDAGGGLCERCLKRKRGDLKANASNTARIEKALVALRND